MTLLTLALLLLAPAPAHAGKAEQRAEIHRLLEEIDRLAEKNAWTGVERAYLKLVSLDRRGDKLDHDVHLLGATAAQSRGDSYAVYLRLERALQVERRQPTLEWLATLVATNTRVSLEISPLVGGEVPLESVDPITDPAQLKVLDAARAALAEKRYFEGLLPMGRYRFGDKRFDLYGQPELELTLRPGENQQGPSVPEAVASAPAPPSRALVLASTLAVEERAYDSAAEGVRAALAEVEGVEQVVVRPLPALRLYADFDAATLELLQIDPRGVADAVSDQLGIPIGQISVRASSVAVPQQGRTAEDLGQVRLPVGDGEVNLDAIGAVREAPDRAAAIPGLDVTVAADADVDAVRAAVARLLEGSAPARELGLLLE